MNEPTRPPHRSIFVCIALASLSAVGCASRGPLTAAKVAQAERAVEDAQQAGAAVSAPLEFRTAQDKLKAAQAAIDGEYARALAANQRVNAMSDEMNQYIKVLRQELERLPK